ncbi:helix-turn-helix transcriptional regulator [Aeromicrobium sp. 179-A 4D2 NHS]|uniref:helix-turn-helix transcriptional regulator n=1 Tax=Aeromicrobium sp. 179-A 4D2 NHS TaxID=3142375 RepID=UPI0039A22FAA
MINQLLSVAAVAETLGCSRGHVYNLIAAGAFPTVNIGSGTRPKTRVRERDVIAFVDHRTTSIERRSDT